jgi:hypothetical protein
MSTLPFTAGQFLEVFERYHAAVGPAPVLLLALAAVVVGVLLRGGRVPSRIAWGILASLWAWMAVAYHAAVFSAINPAAWLFAVGFAAAAGAFAWRGAARGTLPQLHLVASRDALLGALLIAYALVAYPALGYLSGQRYPAMPTFGLPCPTTIFTLGVLLCTTRPAPAHLFGVPVLWAVIGTSAAILLNTPQDLALGAAAAIAVAARLSPPRPAYSRARSG